MNKLGKENVTLEFTIMDLVQQAMGAGKAALSKERYALWACMGLQPDSCKQTGL